MDHIDVVESRVNSFKKKHNAYLKNNDELRVTEFLKLATAYYHKPEIVSNPEFRNKIQNSLPSPDTEKEDIFDMSFYAWIKSKIEGTTLYETTLNLINP